MPEIVDGPPLDLDVHAGMMETLTCVGRGIPIPTLTWLRNGMEIQNETLPNVFIVDRTISSFTIESTLTLEVVEPILDGNYTCRAGNAYGGVANTSILTILTGTYERISRQTLPRHDSKKMFLRALATLSTC